MATIAVNQILGRRRLMAEKGQMGDVTLAARLALDKAVSDMDDAASGKVDRNGSGQVGMGNLADDVKLAMTGGAVAVVGHDAVGVPQMSADILDGLVSDPVWDRSVTFATGSKWVVSGGVASRASGTYNRMASVPVAAGELLRVENLTTNEKIPYLILVDSLDSLNVLWTDMTGPKDDNMLWSGYLTRIPADGILLINSYGTSPRVYRSDWLGFAAGTRYASISDTKSVEGDIPVTLDRFLVSDVWDATTNTVRIGSVNGGVITNGFDSLSGDVRVHVAGTSTVSKLALQLKTVAGSKMSYRMLDTVAAGDFAFDAAFDAASAHIYDKATGFAILLNSVDISSEGSIRIDRVAVTDGESMRHHRLYSPTLIGQLGKLYAEADLTGARIDGIERRSDDRLTSPDGTFWRLSVANDGALTAVRDSYDSVLLMGNSILLGMDSDGSHGGAFGMAASGPSNDWAAILSARLIAANPDTTVVRLHDAPFEQAENKTDATSYIQANKAMFAGRDLVVIQIGDNVNTQERVETFRASFPSLLDEIAGMSPTARVVVTGIWFDKPAVAQTIETAAKAHDAVYVSMQGIRTGETEAITGTPVSYRDGSTGVINESWHTHPGDEGHRLIAQRLAAAIGIQS